MARIYVEFGAYGAIGDFEVEEGMTQEEMCNTAWEITEEFAANEMTMVYVGDDEEY